MPSPTTTTPPPEALETHEEIGYTVPSERLAALVPQARAKRSTLGAYFSLLPNRSTVLPAVAILINLRHAPAYINPMLVGYLINELCVSKAAGLHALPLVLVASFGLSVLNVATTLPQRLLLSRQRRGMTAGLRRALMRRVHRLAFTFHDRSQVGEIQNKFTGDIAKLEGLQGYIFEVLLLQSVAIVAMLSILARKDWHLIMLLLVAVPINVCLYRLFWKPIRAQNERLRKAETGFSAFLFEALIGLRVTRAHGVEEFAEERLGSHASAVAASGYRLDKIHAFFNSSAWASTQFLSMGVVAASAWLCAHDKIRPGDLAVILAYFVQISGGLDSFLNGMPSIAAANDALGSLSELFASEDHEDDRGKPPLSNLRGAVELKGVSFRYPRSNAHSLRGLSLAIPAGTSVALVGASGSGKSTAASIILGFYTPLEGQVLIDGQDLTTIDRRSLRRQVGVVSQDVVLFHDTILGNIAWGDPAPDRARVEEAARLANAHSFIAALPDGYLHVLGDRGAGLSGGQRQRLAIARALYREPRLLVLDEATSALDPESERVVHQALGGLMSGRTTIIIAHRLSTVRSADRIVVLDGGEAVESGSYDELMRLRGRFHAHACGLLL